MKSTRQFLILAIVAWLTLPLPFPSWADFASGFRAYARGDYDTALKEFRRLADRGDASAQYNLGLMYDKGHGVPQDDKEALRWYRMAAEQGIPGAQVYVGNVYFWGQDTQRDYTEALRWYRLAAKQRKAPALNNLGVLYLNGLGVTQNYAQAHMWFTLAATHGYQHGNRNRDYTAHRMTPEQIAEAQKLANEWTPEKIPQDP